MALNYSKRILRIDVLGSKDSNSDVIYNVQWNYCCTCTDTDIHKHITYETEFDTDSISSFKSYDSLEEPDVIGWIESTLTTDKDTSIKAELVKLINNWKCGTIKEKPLPWARTNTISYS